MADLVDFSSFSKEEEKTFIPFEKLMRDNERHAFRLGFGIAGAFLVLSSLAVIFLYTPCTAFCERAPGGCKDAQIAAFKSSCSAACRALEKEAGLQIVRESKGADGKMVTNERPVDGTEYVQTLAACAFAGGGGLTCEAVVKKATERGLWCEEKP